MLYSRRLNTNWCLLHLEGRELRGKFNWCLPLTNGELQVRCAGSAEKMKPDLHQRCTAKQHETRATGCSRDILSSYKLGKGQ